MSDELITNGVEAVKKGDKKLARQLLGDAIRVYPNDERSWGWFYNVAENDTERLQCVKQVMRINPNNTRAKQLLINLRGSIPISAEAGESTRIMAEKRRRFAIRVAVVAYIIIVIASVYILKNYRAWVGGGFIILSLLIFGYPIFTKTLDIFLDKKLKEEKRAIRGAKSEEKIGEMLAELSEDFLVLHDIESPYGNIDHIVISKRNGLFLIETKSHGGHVTLEDDDLQVNGKPPEKDFITQTLNNTYWLKQEISNLIGPTPWITPILVFTNAFVVAPKPIKNVRVMNKKYLINSLNRLGDKKNIANDQIWEQRGKIAQKLVGVG
jgi:Nuclease-related domain.